MQRSRPTPVSSPSEDGGAGFRPSEPIPPRLQRFDPRVVELVRLLARETAREVVERSLKAAEARKGPKRHEE